MAIQKPSGPAGSRDAQGTAPGAMDPDMAALHGGGNPDHDDGVTTPVVLSSTFDYPQRHDGTAAPYIYTRYANPTIEAVERTIAALERTDDACLLASGMAAISSGILATLRSRDTVLASPHLYGGTRLLFDTHLPRLGIQVHYLPDDVPPTADLVAAHRRPSDRMLFLESPTNPMLRILDVKALAAAGRETGLVVMLDNTFAGPVLSRPAEVGVDLVMESASKTLGGHSDLIAGTIAGSSEHMAAVRETRKVWGLNADPELAYRLGRGIKTLAVRVRQSGATATALAHALTQEPWIEHVHHPTLPNHPDHALATATLDGPLPLVTIVLKGGEAAAVQLRQRTQIIRPAPSLGGVESLLSLPSETSHAHLGQAGRAALGIMPGTVRISVGLEPMQSLLSDLHQAATDSPRRATEPI